MISLKYKFAIGCLIQWYEIELVEEYLQSVKNAVDMIENKENVIIDLHFNCDQTLEKLDENQLEKIKIDLLHANTITANADARVNDYFNSVKSKWKGETLKKYEFYYEKYNSLNKRQICKTNN